MFAGQDGAGVRRRRGAGWDQGHGTDPEPGKGLAGLDWSRKCRRNNVTQEGLIRCQVAVCNKEEEEDGEEEEEEEEHLPPPEQNVNKSLFSSGRFFSFLSSSCLKLHSD